MNSKNFADKEKNGVHLVIVGGVNFPRGSAPTSRVKAYFKGIIDNNGIGTMICLRPIGIRSFGDKEIPVSGTVEGIKYIYSPGRTIRPASFLLQLFYELKGLFMSLPVIWKLNRRQKIDSLLFLGTLVPHELFLWLVARCLGIPIIREKCELPLLDRSTCCKKLRAYIYERVMYKLYDGLIIISKSLEEHSKPLIRKKAKYIMVPILVDMSRFENVPSDDNRGKYIAYCGDPSGNKDGVPILIEAFSKIASRYPEVNLYIIGDSHEKHVLMGLKEQARKLNVEDQIVFVGKVSLEQIPGYICNSSVLALARPTSIQAKYGFSTKLGEYLMTGKPVVLTDVGPISDYLQDGESAFIVPPDSVEAFAEKLDYVLANPDLAQKVGLKGKGVAVANFSYRVHGKRISKFIEQLAKQKHCN